MDQMQLKETNMNNTEFPKILFQLDDGASAPTQGHTDDAGWDLYAKDDGQEIKNESGEILYIKYDTGVRCDPGKAFLLLFPRSSVTKTDLIMANSVGLIDPGYRGCIIAVFRVLGKNGPDGSVIKYKKGERIAQIVPMLPIQASFLEGSLAQSGRGTGGFGSTGS